VLFEEAIRGIAAQGINVFIEIGPHSVLRTYLNDCLKEQGVEGRVLSTMVRNDDSAKRIWSTANQAVITGVEIDWKRLFPVAAPYTKLPTYPWQREKHWHTVTPESVGLLAREKQHHLLGYPLAQHELTWENQIDVRRNAMLADHVVGDSIVFPGAGFAELALAVASTVQPKELIEIEELEIRAPLVLSADHATLLRSVVDPRDGSLTIKARPYASDEPWALHATARILEDVTPLALNTPFPAVPEQSPDFTGDSHLALTRAAHLQYGPAFRCISHGWTMGKQVLAALITPESIRQEAEEGVLHPAVLDCTFQLIIQLLKEDVGLHNGFTFVPVKVGRLTLRRHMGQPIYALATLRNRSNHSLTADFTLFDENGEVMAQITEARFRSVRLGQQAGDHLRLLDYYAAPQLHALADHDAASVLPFAAVRQSIADVTRHAASKGSHRRYSEEVDPLLDSLHSQFVRQALQSIATDNHLSTQQISQLATGTPAIASFIIHLLQQAEQDGLLQKTEQGWNIASDGGSPSAEDTWNSLLGDYPDYFQLIHSAGRIGMHLSALLQGTRTFAEVCPKEPSRVSLTRQLLGADGRQQIGQAVRKLIKRTLEELPAGHRLSLLEVGNGQPAYAMDVCNATDFTRSDYLFAAPPDSQLA